MRKYNVKIENCDNGSITELTNVSVKAILGTLKGLHKNDYPIDHIKSRTSRNPRIYKNKYKNEILKDIKNFKTKQY